VRPEGLCQLKDPVILSGIELEACVAVPHQLCHRVPPANVDRNLYTVKPA
jgi:hypothetical protein